MLIVISPAKKLDMSVGPDALDCTEPEFLDDSCVLNATLRTLTAAKLCKLQGISEKLGELNAERNAAWQPPFTKENAKPALLSFTGDVYQGMQAAEFAKRDLKYAQDHLRILSGLYGVLRPLDLIQAYRLEMGTPLKTRAAKNLYEFWGTRITESLNAVLQKQRPAVLVNLASNEYFNSVQSHRLAGRVVTPVFKDANRGAYRVLSFFAKKARGYMASWIVRNRVKKPDDLKDFDVEGYAFNDGLSTENEFVFTRGEL
ncbi:MAG: peroxide stress protein YaaA [Planctomycetota bacterium]|nr:peroxide stress protein YaaA [Planctomycetota bacterium]